MRPPVRRLPQILTLAASIVGFVLALNWAYIPTYRLYLAQRIDAAPGSVAAQRFDVEGTRVVPQIVARQDDLIAFKTARRRPSTLRVGVRPSGRAAYEVRWRDGATVEVLARGEADRPIVVAQPVPARAAVVELVSRGALTWIDPQIALDLRYQPYLAAIALLLAMAMLTGKRRGPLPGRHDPAVRIVWFRRLAFATSAVVSVVGLEAGLRVLGDRVPPGIASERHDLGEVRRDPRWVDTLRYGRRLRSGVDAMNEWRYGDIVRMGFIPAGVSDGVLHRFPFHTDGEGFRNPRVRDRIDVAALGDSFTDATTLPIGDAWPTLVEERTRLAVQNYGTAGFGPQQELLTLRDFAITHHPRIVVLAYFAGNDLFDAEAFDDFARSGGAIRRPEQGWRIKDVVTRADTWFVVSAAQAAGAWASTLERAEARGDIAPLAASIGADPPPATEPVFDRGMFTAAIGGRVIRWAFMPPYLNTLNFSEQDLAARRGWTLTRDAIAEMHDLSRRSGAEFVVMFLPFKSQVYLPWLAQAVPPAELSRALRFYLPNNPGPVDVARMLRNRLAQNALMRRFCEARGIPLLDTTADLQAHLEAGENVYFPDESHLNERGMRIVADALTAYLKRR